MRTFQELINERWEELNLPKKVEEVKCSFLSLGLILEREDERYTILKFPKNKLGIYGWVIFDLRDRIASLEFRGSKREVVREYKLSLFTSQELTKTIYELIELCVKNVA